MLSVWPSISLILFFFLFFLQLCDYNSPYTDCSLTPSAYLLDQWTLSLIFKSDCFTKFVRLIQFSHGFFATHFSLFRFFFLLVAFFILCLFLLLLFIFEWCELSPDQLFARRLWKEETGLDSGPLLLASPRECFLQRWYICVVSHLLLLSC